MLRIGKQRSISQKKQTKPGAKPTVQTPAIIQNFGDSYAISKVVESSVFADVLKNAMPKDYDTLMCLICHKLIKGSAMQYVESWALGNAVSTLYPAAQLSSQRISDFLKKLGKENVWRKFFKDYIERVTGERVGIIIDSTGLPNEIDIPLSAWGSHGGESERETRFLMVVDRISGNPLYFRYAAGNIVDVTTLSNTLEELQQMGVSTSFALVDAGYFSEDNIKELYRKNIAFLTRLPAGRKLYKSLIREHQDVENAENIVLYGKRALYVKCIPVDLFGNEGIAYVVCDIKRKGNEINNFLISAKEDKLSNDEINEALASKGKFIIVSSEKIPTNEVIPLYYTRQSAENLFGVSKSFLDFLPLRTHNIDTLRGYLMLTFISLLVYIAMKKKLKNEFTVEGALIESGNLMCKTFDNEIIISEPTKKMKAVASLLDYMVPMKLGV